MTCPRCHRRARRVGPFHLCTNLSCPVLVVAGPEIR